MATAAKRAVIIDILSDAKGFIKGTDDAAGAADRLDKNTQQLGRTLVSAYAAKQIIDFGAAAVKSASEDAAAQAILKQALINTTGATDDQVASVEDWIDKTQRATGVADDELRPAMATLTSATKDVSEAQDLMGLSMDLARAKGISLETAATAIAKAHSGNTTALAKLVPGLKEAGEKSLDFATATQRLNEQVKGQAAAWADTDEGKLARMNIQWAEMQEQIGGALLPVMGKLLGIVTGVFDWFNSLDGETQDLIVTIALVAGGLYVAVSAFNAVKLAVQGLGLTAGNAMPWLLGITVAVAAVAAAVEIFGHGQSDADKRAKEFYDTVATGVDTIDKQRLALVSAADAADEFADAAYGEADKKLRDTITGSDEYAKSLVRLGGTMDDLKRITRGGADAQQRLVEIRRKAIETGQVEIHTGTQLVGINDDIAKGWIESGAAAQYAQEGTVRLSGAGNDLIDVLENQVTAQYASIEVAKTHMQLGDAQAAAWLKSTGALANMNMLEQTAAQLLLLHADATNKLGDETETTHDRMVKLVAVTVDLRKAFDAIIGPSLDLESAQRALLDATDATVAAMIENGATLDINTVAGRENRDVIQSQVEAMLAQADAMVKNGATTEEATTYALNYRDALINQLEMLGLNEDQVNDYLDVLGLTPENVTTSLAVANKEVVKTQLEEVLSQLTDVDKGAIAAIQADIDEGKFQEAADAINNLPGSHSVVVSLKSDGSSLRISGAVADFRLQMNARVAGGPVTAGTPYIVGEKRPELFVPDTNGYIVPSVPAGFGATSTSAGPGASGIHIDHVEVHNDTDADAFFRIANFHMAGR